MRPTRANLPLCVLSVLRGGEKRRLGSFATRRRYGGERVVEALEAAQGEKGVGDVDHVVERGRFHVGAGLKNCIGDTDERPISVPLVHFAANGLR